MGRGNKESSERPPSEGQARSFGGCKTCRIRHLKCDEGRPTCAVCRASGRVCGGYEKTVFFEPGPDAEPGSTRARFRRVLLTEGERQRLSQHLTEEVPPKNAYKRILGLDKQVVEDSKATHYIDTFDGPFGVFRARDSASREGSQSIAVDRPSRATAGNVGVSGGGGDASSAALPLVEPVPASHDGEGAIALSADDGESALQNLERSASAILDHPELTSMLLFDSFAGLYDGGSNGEFDWDTFQPEVLPPSQFALSDNPEPTDDQFFNNAAAASSALVTGERDTSPPHGLTSTEHGSPEVILRDAVTLVQHYSGTVLRLLTPFRDSKTPWHILFLPQMRNCLASLAIGESLDHASLCVFHGTLATSALSLGNLNSSQEWLDKGESHRHQAREYCRYMLKTAYNVPKQSKYKTILMALMTMVQLSNESNSPDETEFYFLEAEKFIRLRGLARKKSRKVRLLHHCYAFERIMYESILVVPDTDSRYRHHVRRAVESSGLMGYHEDSPAFRLPKRHNADEGMFRVKTQEEGENDLLSERPGIFSATLYPEIFGIPEPWIVLISLILRLGREKDMAEAQSVPDPLPLASFLNWAKILKTCIDRLRSSQDQTATSIEHRIVDSSALSSLLDAMENAITIYFYRRIYDVDAPSLQNKVRIVCDALWRCNNNEGGEQANNNNNSNGSYGSVRLIWPAFIAACEADDAETRESLSTWFAKCAAQSGLRSFSNALQKVKDIWDIKRDGANRPAVAWTDLMSAAPTWDDGTATYIQ